MRTATAVAVAGIILATVALGARPAMAQSPAQVGGGYIQGYVYGFDMYNELIPLEWVQVSASNANYHFSTSTGGDGGYLLYLPVGAYNVTVYAPGFTSSSQTAAVPNGGGSQVSFYLQESGVPVPEFPSGVFPMLLALIGGAALLTKRATRRKR